jgi:hypothetical protein
MLDTPRLAPACHQNSVLLRMSRACRWTSCNNSARLKRVRDQLHTPAYSGPLQAALPAIDLQHSAGKTFAYPAESSRWPYFNLGVTLGEALNSRLNDRRTG